MKTAMPGTVQAGDAATPSEASEVLRAAQRVLARRAFCTLATASTENRPHVVGVGYVAVGAHLYIHSIESSRKVRNIQSNPKVGICVPTRAIPFAPPFCVQFQGTAEVLAPDDPEITGLLAAGHLKRITAHGALAVLGTCIIRVTPGRTLSTYGVGVSIRAFLRDPFHANRSVAIG